MECAICLDVIEELDAVTLPCDHTFHRDCINEWSRRANADVSCPNCRSTVERGVVEEIQQPLGWLDFALLPVMLVVLLFQNIPRFFRKIAQKCKQRLHLPHVLMSSRFASCFCTEFSSTPLFAFV